MKTEEETKLRIEVDKLTRWIDILNNCLDTKEELCNFYKEQFDILKRDNEILMDKIKQWEKVSK